MPKRIPAYLQKWYNTMTDRGYIVQLLLLIVLILLLFFLVQARASNERLIQIAESSEDSRTRNTEILREVQSCTTPEGECAKRGQRNSGAAIETINKVTIYASYCAIAKIDNPPKTAEEIKVCVQQNLAKEKKP